MKLKKGSFDYLEFEILRDKLFDKTDKCAKCGTKKNLTIHHKEMVSLHPEKMFDETNCIILCRKCHNEIHSGKNKHNVYT